MAESQPDNAAPDSPSALERFLLDPTLLLSDLSDFDLFQQFVPSTQLVYQQIPLDSVFTGPDALTAENLFSVPFGPTPFPPPVAPADEQTVVSLSTAFPPSAEDPTFGIPDVVLLSSDLVYFYVHSGHLLQASTTGFDPLLFQANQEHDCGPIAPIQLVPIRESSHVLNIMLHIIYGWSCAQYDPSQDDLLRAVDALTTHGVPLQNHAGPGTATFALLLAKGRHAPLEFYTLAAQHGLEALAVPLSSLLLSLRMDALPPETAERMGPVYLKRLVLLQHGRLETLKAVLREPPDGHPPPGECVERDKARLSNAWRLMAAYFLMEARPELTSITLDITFKSLGKELSCTSCKEALEVRVVKLVEDWDAVKRTI